MPTGTGAESVRPSFEHRLTRTRVSACKDRADALLMPENAILSAIVISPGRSISHRNESPEKHDGRE